MTNRQYAALDKRFVLVSFFLALLLNMVTLSHYDTTHWRPDFLALLVFYWAVHRPTQFSMGIVFLAGMVMDVHSGVLLGQNATVYVILCFLGVLVHRRLKWFGLWAQAAQILPVFLLVQVVTIATRVLVGGALPPMSIFIASFLQALLWPLLCVMLSRIEAVIQDRHDRLSV